MLLPTKHTKIYESFYGIGGLIIKHLSNKPISIDDLFESISISLTKKNLSQINIVNKFYLSLCFLYSVGVIDIQDNGIYLK